MSGEESGAQNAQNAQDLRSMPFQPGVSMLDADGNIHVGNLIRAVHFLVMREAARITVDLRNAQQIAEKSGRHLEMRPLVGALNAQLRMGQNVLRQLENDLTLVMLQRAPGGLAHVAELTRRQEAAESDGAESAPDGATRA